MKHDKIDPQDAGTDADAGESEAIVRSLGLSRPSKRLDWRISRLLDESRPRRWAGRIVAGIAAAVVLVVGLGRLLPRHAGSADRAGTGDVKPTPVASVARPLRIERDASTLADGGIVGFAGRVPLHGYHVHGVREIWYVDPNGKRLCVTVPTDRVVLVPVHTF